uniref:Uncharacterized protein n=1 Tax=Glossina palpalis gambiensis TaxID=67801 RepID=A0A1B0ATQ4_9MUSC
MIIDGFLGEETRQFHERSTFNLAGFCVLRATSMLVMCWLMKRRTTITIHAANMRVPIQMT